MKSSAGLTLLEVLVAIVVLAVGVLMAAAMQTSALRASNDARAIQGVTKIAEAEIELRRQIDLTTTAGKATTCKTAVQTGYTCQVEVRPCQLSGTALSCTGVSSASADADQAVVTVTGPRSKTVTLRTVKAR
jgi:prepilin-type N-terminal cleavage/methylation domain-containing protein